MNVTWILRIESVAVGLVGIVGILSLHGSPPLLVPALLAPDLSILGYLSRSAGSRGHVQPGP